MNPKEDIRPVTDRMRTAIGLLEEDVRAGKLTDQDSFFDLIETGLKTKKAGKQTEK